VCLSNPRHYFSCRSFFALSNAPSRIKDVYRARLKFPRNLTFSPCAHHQSNFSSLFCASGEDFWNEGDAENAASSQQSPSAADVLSGEEEPEGQNGVKIEVDDDEPKNGDDEEEEEIDVDAGSQPPPKLTLNANLATDPALRINKEHQQVRVEHCSRILLCFST
jgi:hypothetical protein